MKSNYDLVLEVIENYDDEDVLNDFKSRFEEGKNVSKKEFYGFCKNCIDDMSEVYYIRKNWEYIDSGGDYSVFDEE
jgi:hypothetical protein